VSKIRFRILPNGDVEHLVSSQHAPIYKQLGKPIETRRCSHVETWRSLSRKAQLRLFLLGKVPFYFVALPCMLTEDERHQWLNVWWADMAPVKGPILGPFDDRADALSAEEDYLTKLPNSN
jgi:hypothetical protein